MSTQRSSNPDDRHEEYCVNRPLIAEWGYVMKKQNQISQRGYQDRLESLLKAAQLQPLRSLETATKKRRALKKKAAKDSGLTKSSTTVSG